METGKVLIQGILWTGLRFGVRGYRSLEFFRARHKLITLCTEVSKVVIGAAV